MDKIRHRFRGADDEIPVLFRAAHAREGRDHLTEIHAGDALCRQPCNGFQPGSRGFRAIRGGDRNCRRAGQEIAVHRWSDKDALALLARNLKNGVAHAAALGLVQQQIFARTRDDLKEAVACHGRDPAGIAAGAVDKITAAHALARRGHKGEVLAALNGRDREVPLQFHAVVHGVARGRDGQLIRADDAGIRHVQRAADLPGKARLHPPRFLAGNHAHAGDAIDVAARIQCIDNRFFLRRAKGADEGAVVPVRDVQRAGGLVQKRDALGVQSGL